MEIFCKDFQEAFQVFQSNGVHGQNCNKPTYAVAQYTRDGEPHYFRARSEAGSHVEEAVIRHFEGLLTHNALASSRIKLYLSNSPCYECCEKIINFVDASWLIHGAGLEMEVVFSALYLVKRPSCEQDPRCFLHRVSAPTHEAQARGLRNLSSAKGVRLRTFKEQDWVHLRSLLGHSSAEVTRLKEHDDTVRDDFIQIMNGFKDEGRTLRNGYGHTIVVSQW